MLNDLRVWALNEPEKYSSLHAWKTSEMRESDSYNNFPVALYGRDPKWKSQGLRLIVCRTA